MMKYFLQATTIFVQNQRSGSLLEEITQLFCLYFVKPNVSTISASALIVLLSDKGHLLCHIFGDIRTPKTSYLVYNNNHKHNEHMVQNNKEIEVPAKLTFDIAEHVKR